MSNDPTMSESPGPGVRRIHADIAVPARGEPQQVHSLVIDSGVLHTVDATNNKIPQGVQRIAFDPLANAHDHGRPHSPAHYGVRDQRLEFWLAGLATLPALDAYTTTAAALCQAARGGVSSVVHVHDPLDMADVVDEATQVMQAADDVGLRMGLVVPIRDRVHSVYGFSGDLTARVPERFRAAVERRWGSPLPPLWEQFASVGAIAASAPALVDVQLGPIGPQWCTDEALRAVADDSAEHGRRVHMHLLESRHQREWADAAFPEGLLHYLDRIGLLTPRLTVAHGVWLRRPELDLLAEREVTVVVNTSSNLRLRSGVAPVAQIVAAGVDVALGLDSMPLHEPGDMFMEWDVTGVIHGVDDNEAIDDALRHGVTTHGHVVAGREARPGRFEGGPGDVAIALWDSRSDGPLESDAVWQEMRRRGGAGLEALYVAGELVVDDGEVMTVDEDELRVELASSIERWERIRSDDGDVVDAYRNAIRRFYGDGCHLVGMHAERPQTAQASRSTTKRREE